MIYTVENTAGCGNPVRVFDANAVEILNIVECDTETGRVVKYAQDELGRFILDTDNLDCCKLVEEYYPPPLTVLGFHSYYNTCPSIPALDTGMRIVLCDGDTDRVLMPKEIEYTDKVMVLEDHYFCAPSG